MTPTWKTRLRGPVLDYALILLGVLTYSFGLTVIIKPVNVPAGGLTGIAQVLNYLLGLPMGLMILVMNVPLFIISFRRMGRRFIIRTLVATAATSLFVELIEPFAERLHVTDDMILSVLYGGVVTGLGLGLVIMRGATSGGTDILSRLVLLKWPHLSMGRVNLALNAVVIVGAAIAFQSAEAALYAVLMQYVSSSVIDMMLSGLDHASVALIISRQPQEMADAIFREMHRGCTGLDSHGLYTGRSQTTLMVAARSHEMTQLKKLAHRLDPECFIVFLNAREVLGLGFKTMGNR